MSYTIAEILPSVFGLQLPHECNEILLLLFVELDPEDYVKGIHRYCSRFFICDFLLIGIKRIRIHALAEFVG